MYVLTTDFGSTFTKVTAIDTQTRSVIGTAKAFTTIETDICIGFENAMQLLYKQTGKIEFSERLACSSAGGGLKMVAVGLVPDLTSKASRMAASSAGAKVVKTYSYELSAEEQDEIKDINPDIILLSGGTDGGNKEVIIHNAKKLAEIDAPLSVIVAGNKSAMREVAEILSASGKLVIPSKNVMPVFNRLEIAPAKSAIRDLFIKKIIVAKGLSKAQEMMTAQIIPTPLAVLEGCELLSRGTESLPGWGEFLAVDVGGATTDVYSMAAGRPTDPNTLEKGLPEPFAKRSVEGDLGLRYSMPSLCETATFERIAYETGLPEQVLHDWSAECRKDPSIISSPGSTEKLIDEKLGALAVEIATDRHCGTLESVFTPFGETFMQTGKDLRKIRATVGIGGPIINSPDPAAMLKAALASPRSPMTLKPESSKFFIDKKYIFASMGLVGKEYPELALTIMNKEIIEV